MFNKTIVRHMVIGEPVIIEARTKPVVEESEVAEESESEIVEEPEPQPPPIPPEVLEKIFAEIDEIEAKSKQTEETLHEAQEMKAQAEQLKKHSEELEQQAQKIRDAAKKIRDDARAAADKLIADTKHDAEELLAQTRKEGYDAGYAEGKEIGIKDGREHIEDELADIVRQANDNAQKTIRDAKEQTAEYFIRAEDDIARIVNMAVEKVLPDLFVDMPQTILPAVREAVHHVRDQKEIKIHVEPYSYDLILMARSEFQSMLSDGTAIIEIISDESLKPGDCVIETPNGNVDARLSTQIELMRSAIQSVMNKA